MDYDVLLKSIVQMLHGRLVQRLTGSRAVGQLSVEFDAVVKRLPDLVLQLEDGRIFHLELQSENDVSMPSRMLEYWVLLDRRYAGVELIQAVLYIGNARLTMLDGYTRTKLHYRYHVLDIREFDAVEFLESPVPEEQILALLCGDTDPRTTLRQLLSGWSGLPRNQIKDLFQKLVIVSGLRRIEPAILEELHKMPITADINENLFVRLSLEEGERRGRLQGEVQVLRRQLERRFGALPDWAATRLEAAQTDQLEHWADQILEAKTVEEVFA